MKKKSITIKADDNKMLMLFIAMLKDVAKDMGLKVEVNE